MEADIGRPDNTELSTRSDGTRSSRPRMDLRSLPLSAHYFWDDSQPKHMNHTTTIDKASTSGNRNLPENEIAVMALNEVAADRGRGFFFHFRNRDCWKKAKGDTCPTSRTPILQPMPDFPTIAFMNFVWDARTKAGFLAASHRSRYLKCDGQFNLPHAATPMYAIQYATGSRYPLYATSSNSLAILATSSTFYLASTAELEQHIGRWPKDKRPPTCSNPKSRIDTAPYLWTATKKANEIETQDVMKRLFEVNDIETLYDMIIQRCEPGSMTASFTARELQNLLPRPTAPESGVALGTPIGIAPPEEEDIRDEEGEAVNKQAGDSSNPKSRRGGHLARGRSSRQTGEDRE